VSDASQGPDWWQASDGKWYPPEQAPGGAATAGAPSAAGVGMSQWGALADWPTRALGILIDFALVVAVYVIGFILTIIFSIISSTLGSLFSLVWWLVEVGIWLYLGYLVGLRGYSPGMAIVGIKCVSEETGELIGGGQGVIRSIAHIVDNIICYVGWLFPLWDAKRQTLADKIMKTVVLSDQPKQAFSIELFTP
jgi:uncharacterized RDD family membrane protein YckC